MKPTSLYLFSFFILLSAGANCQEGSDKIAVNQVGFYPHENKFAVLRGDAESNAFFLLQGSDTVYRGKLSGIRKSGNSSLFTRIADFSSVTQKAEYRIFIPGVGYSCTFLIGDTVNRRVSRIALKAFYYQRASIPLLPSFAGKWARAGGHPDTVVYIHGSAADRQRPEGSRISSPGGWYDAGDYNKYIVNAGITMGTLLSAYEDFPNYFRALKTNIPEISSGCPDILNECLYNLRWMMTMQDPHDGGVYHKCTNASFDAMAMPDACASPRYVVEKTTAASLDFAAVMAQAARVYSSFRLQFPGLSDSCIQAARSAWNWAETHPSAIYDQDSINRFFSPKITTGAYGDRHFNDEFFWAASEIYCSTHDAYYLKTVYDRLSDPVVVPSWNEVGLLGFYSLMRTYRHSQSALLPQLAARIRKKILTVADSLIDRISVNAFGTVMGRRSTDFVWGSNSVAANQAILLINAYFIDKEKKYIDPAISNLDYLLGRNATGFCFVTGLGTRTPLHPHHRPSIADGIDQPVPGFLVGGPNPGRQDHSVYEWTEPETAYTDQSGAYASNEVAINWNAPLVYLSVAVEALHAQWGLK